MDNILEIVTAFILVFLNSFFYAAESAVLLIHRDKVNDIIEKGNSKAAQKLVFIKDNAERFFSTIQICIILTTTLLTVIFYVIIYQNIDHIKFFSFIYNTGAGSFASIVVSVFFASFITILFGGLLSRALGSTAPARFSIVSAVIIVGFSSVLKPFYKFMLFTGNCVLFFLRKHKVIKLSFVADKRMETQLQEGVSNDPIDYNERELINSVYEFSDIDVRDIMIPKPKIYSIQIDTKPKAVLKRVVESGFSRYPVYVESLDDTVGILYNKDLLSLLERNRTFSLKEIVRPVHFVPEKKKVSDVLKDMQNRRINMLMVANEYGSVVGLVTIEDAIEEIVGEVRDENEVIQDHVIKQPDGSLLIDASTTVRELNSEYGLPLEESDKYDSLAGFMIYSIATIPKGGESIESNGYKYTIIKMSRRRISLIKAEKIEG